MRRLSNSISIIICGIAAYFALHWGTDAVLIFASPLHGMESDSFARIVESFARTFSLSPERMLICATAFGALKFGVAGIFAVYLVRRLTGLAGVAPDHDLLEAGLVLVVVTIATMALPFVVTESATALNQFRVPLWLVGLAATLTMVERAAESEPASRVRTWERERGSHPIPATLPRQRGRVSALRWNELRRQANLDCGA